MYLTANMYTASGSFAYAKIRILKKSELYDPATTTLTFQDIWNLKTKTARWPVRFTRRKSVAAWATAIPPEF